LVTFMTDRRPRPRIVVVGGGAGGLELVTRLGDRLGRKGRAEITLIERGRTHFWKPHLHELAAGTVDLDVHELDYLAQSHWHGFRYLFGETVGLEREARQVLVGPVLDEGGEEIVAERRVDYDLLVLAVGSRINDFGTPGVMEHAIALENTLQADRFHRRLVNAFLRAHAQSEPLRPEQLNAAIVGAGATGTELAAELHNATRALVSSGLDNIDPDKHIRLHLIEAAPRILPALPERISAAAHRMLRELGVEVHVGARVAEVLPRAVRLGDGTVIAAEIVVWAAGVKAPPFLRGLGLSVNPLNQVTVRPTLQSLEDPRIFAIGDCAAIPWAGHEPRNVPPRAPGRAPAGLAPVPDAAARPRGPGTGAPALPRLWLAGVAGHLHHRRQPDGQLRRRQHLARGPVRALDVQIALPDAPGRAARLVEVSARHGGAHDRPPDRAAREAALRRGRGLDPLGFRSYRAATATYRGALHAHSHPRASRGDLPNPAACGAEYRCRCRSRAERGGRAARARGKALPTCTMSACRRNCTGSPASRTSW
jgi:NADH dehydrogenase